MFQPTFDRVLIDPDNAEKVSDGGIVVLASTSTPTGTVLAVGPGRPLADGKLMPCLVKVSDRVAFIPGIAASIPLDGKNMLVMEEANVLGTFGKR